MTPQRAANTLYEMWRNATPDERPEIERKLFAAVRRHAQAVVIMKLAENSPDLVVNIAGDAIAQLARGQFREDSLFSTWVQGIAKRKIGEELRGRTRRRRVIDDRISVDALEERDEEEDEGQYRPRRQANVPNFDANILLDQVLLPRDKELASLKHEGFSSKEIAARIGISEEAVNSRWRRLKQKKSALDDH